MITNIGTCNLLKSTYCSDRTKKNKYFLYTKCIINTNNIPTTHQFNIFILQYYSYYSMLEIGNKI